MDDKKWVKLFIRKVRAAHLILLWLVCVLSFVIVMAIATNLFTSTVQETKFGNSDYFPVLLVAFVIFGLLFFGLYMLTGLLNIIRSEKTKKAIRSPVFIALMIVFAFVFGFFVRNIKTLVPDQIIVDQDVSTFIKSEEPNILPDEVFELTNEERINNGITPLKRNPKLDEAALERAKVIIEYDEWAHEATKSGVTFTEAVKKANYWNINYGENLANGQYTSAEVVDGWMNSEGHRANILNTKYEEIGIATYSGELNGYHTVVTIQLFGGYQPPNYSQEYLNNWESALNNLRSVKPSWENIKNFPSTYETNKQDADRLIEIMNIRIYRMEKIVARIKANQWFTAEENRWAYEDESLSEEAEAIANKLNNQVWK